MPALSNQKRENYCRHRAGGLIPAKAAIAAGYMPGSAITTELERDPEIIARCEELIAERNEQREARRAAAAQAAQVVGTVTGYSHAWVLQRLAENAQNAASEGDFKESNAALKLIGEHLGMWGEKGGNGEGSGGPRGAEVIAEAAARLEKLNDHLARFDVPEEPIAIPDQRQVESLIGRAPAAPTREKVLATGSETDVALTAATQADGWTAIDPKTSPEEIVAMIEDKAKP